MAGPIRTDLRACTRCGVEKPLDGFHLTPAGGHRHVCKACRNEASSRRNREWRERNPEEYRKRARAVSKKAYYAANPDVIKEQTRVARFARYGITEDFYVKLLEQQGNACAVCKVGFRDTPVIDHDHACCPGYRSCGTCVRGLLCQHCNHGLGKFRDSLEYLTSAIKYLTREG